MACVLTLTMTASQGNLVFAAEEIPASQEGFESEDLTDPETASLFESENAMDDIDLFTDEAEDDTFSAGNMDTFVQTGDQEINGEGTYTVTYNTIYNFKPVKTGIYKFDFGTNAFEIGLGVGADASSVEGGKKYIFKAEAGKTYTVEVKQILSDEEGESSEVASEPGITTSINITKLPGINSITINSPLPESCEIAREYIAGNQFFLYDVDYALNLENGETATKDDNDYDGLWIKYTDLEGNEVDYDKIELGKEYGYRFYSSLDPSVMSKVYKCKFVSLADEAKKHEVTYDSNTGNLSAIFASPYKDWTSSYNYCFVYNCQQDFEGDVDGFGKKYKSIDIYELTDNGLSNRYSTVKFEKDKTYYIKVMTDHELSENEKTFTICGENKNVEATWEVAPTDFFLEELYPIEVDVNRSFLVRLNDKNEIITLGSGWIDAKYGECRIDYTEDEDGNRVYGVSFSKNKYISLSKTSEKTSIADVADKIPGVSLDDSRKVIPRNYSNSNVFQFTAPEDGGYSFNIDGNISKNYYTNKGDIAYVVKSGQNGYSNIRYMQVNSKKPVKLNKNDTIYAAVYPYTGDITVQVERKLVIKEVKLANPEVVPDVLYSQFLKHNDIESYLGNAKFNVTYIDASGNEKTQTLDGLYSGIEDHQEICLYNNNIYKSDENDEIEYVPGAHELMVFLSGAMNDYVYYEETYPIGKTIIINDLSEISDNFKVSVENSLDLSKQMTEAKVFYIENATEDVVKYKVKMKTDKKTHKLLTSINGNKVEGKIIVDTTYVNLNPHEKAYWEFWGEADSVQIMASDIESVTATIALDEPMLLKDVPGIKLEALTFDVEIKNANEETQKYWEVESGTILDKYGKAELQFANGKGLSDQTDGEVELKLSMPSITSDLIDVDGKVNVISRKDFFGEDKNLPGINEKIEFNSHKKYNGNSTAAIQIPEKGVYDIDVTYNNTDTDEWVNYCVARHSQKQLPDDEFNGSTVMSLEKGVLMLFGDNAENVIVTKVESVRDELKKLYEECKNLKSSDYTEDSWNDLAQEFGNIKEALDGWDECDESVFVSELNSLRNLRNSLILLPKPNPTPYPYYPDPVVTPAPTATPTPTPVPTATPTPSPIPTEEQKPVDKQKPIIDTAKAVGNKVHVQLKGEIENAEGYDFVLCASKKDFKTGKYLDVRKNLTKTEVYFNYIQTGTYYVYCHAWNKVDGKKVYSKWSLPNKVKVVATTVRAPKITSVKIKGRTITVKLSRDEAADGIDLVLGKSTSKEQYGKRPVNYGKQVKKNRKGTTIIFTNVLKGTYYIGAHAFNRSATDNSKVFSRWSNIKKIVIK